MRILLALSFLLIYFCSAAKTDVSDSTYLKIKNELPIDYMKNKWVLKPRNLSKNTTSNKLPNINTKFVEPILILLGLAIIIFLLLEVFKQVRLPQNKFNAEQDIEITDIKSVDLQALISQAIANGNYRLAIRYRFLYVLQKLSLKQLIIWKLEKTNRAYIAQLTGRPFIGEFKELVFIFEEVWYGNKELNLQSYEVLNQKYDYFIQNNKLL